MENRVETSGANSTTQQSRRLWWGIGVAGLMLVFVVGLLALRPWYHQKQVIAEIERFGGDCESEPVGPEWLRRIVGDEVMAGFGDVLVVSLGNTHITDAELVHLKGLTKLQELSLGSNVTDAGLVHLKGMTSLQTLYLDDIKVTDVGVKDLQAALPKCKITK